MLKLCLIPIISIIVLTTAITVTYVNMLSLLIITNKSNNSKLVYITLFHRGRHGSPIKEKQSAFHVYTSEMCKAAGGA